MPAVKNNIVYDNLMTRTSRSLKGQLPSNMRYRKTQYTCIDTLTLDHDTNQLAMQGWKLN